MFHFFLKAMVLPAASDALHFADGGEAINVYVSVKDLMPMEFLPIGEPKMLVAESLQNEKQISVDPISMKESKTSCLSSSSPAVVNPLCANGISGPLPLLPAKYKFRSSSLPNSASSSLRFSSGLFKGKGNKHPNQAAASAPISSLARQHSVALSRLAQLRENHLQRSKSCGEGRACAPSDDFDLWLTTDDGIGHGHRQVRTSFREAGGRMRTYGQDGNELRDDEEFKCGALCLFLPGFGKGKPVRARKEESETAHVVSRTVSLEKFECGSWTSSAIMNDHNEESGEYSSNQLYFDLPLELIRSSVNDANSPVSSAFIFDKDRKGVLKNGTMPRGGGGGDRRSHESARHVRFSTSTTYPSSPSPCITPRLRKAREDFNAFIEAQSA